MTFASRYCRERLFIAEATLDDAPAIKKMVDSAYSKYIDRIGKPPAPMTEDYHEVIRRNSVFVLKDIDGTPTGAIVFMRNDEARTMKIKNLVVDPGAQGRGYGRVLMNYAEEIALSLGLLALELYTNVKMYENIQLYAKLGFSEDRRSVEDGFERVYFRKELSQG